MSSKEEVKAVSNFREDLSALIKLRLNTFVLITTAFGYLLARKGSEFDAAILIHTILGTAGAAFGSAAFNQLMEIDLDLMMKRTADRPLPARRMSPITAFAVGWVLSAAGIIHLAVMVNAQAAYLTAATLAIYVLIYTPMKRMSSLNTLVGAIPGAIPPVIGWVAGGGFLFAPQAWFLFGLLFLWQLPHFVAINWLCREEYEAAAYRMWSNGDISGKKSGILCAGFSILLALFALYPMFWGFAGALWSVSGAVLGMIIFALSLRFIYDEKRSSCRVVFFSTLIYLPLALSFLLSSWKN